MENLDDTDMRILELLAEDARRPFSAIGEEVGLSGPAVSDRVTRLREAGVIRRFTVDVDRSTLRGGVPVLIEATIGPGEAGSVRETLATTEAVEHVFTAADGTVTALARVPEGRVRDWVAERLGDATVESLDVTLVDDVRWTPSVGGGEFALECAECGNTVTAEGTSTRLGGEAYHFCCSSCEAKFTDRYERLEEGA
ncbi:AsnC family transcriptional regulator [Halorarius halobius]|uniref:AsnC family transcriptional regulator n=1 Tax=Halorarius halobius TaxID=2962671 RepID=UPI0020CDFF4D|nr:AsnC family transcriptional regulator [Halorarius halobius]